MQVILNFVVVFLIYFFSQIFLYRFLKVNLNKLFVVLLIFVISIVVGFYSSSTDFLMNLININLVAEDHILKFRLKNARKLDRKVLNLLRNQEIKAIIS